jgi:putative membrane protein
VTTGSKDPGLQQERTALAWRRTGLSLVVAAVAVARLADLDGASAAVAIALGALVLALWAVLLTTRRGRGTTPSLREPVFDSMLYDGVLPALLTATIGLLCVAEIASLL